MEIASTELIIVSSFASRVDAKKADSLMTHLPTAVINLACVSGGAGRLVCLHVCMYVCLMVVWLGVT